MKKTSAFFLLLALLLTLPLLGIVLAGYDAATYLEFPPRTQYVAHAPFSWPVFIGLTAAISAVVTPFLRRVYQCRNSVPRTIPADRFPWWGTVGIMLGIVSWILAWTRFDWLAPLQLYTFTPLWLAYIIVINAVTFRRTGRCLLTHRTRYLLKLFPLSAAFWWFFEYLNRFVQNWYYTASDSLSGLHYFIAATLPFATVLPAVLSTEECLASNPRLTAGLDQFLPLRLSRPRLIAFIVMIFACAGLLCIGRFPDLLFPLLWVAPLLLLLSFQWLENKPSFFKNIGNGDWRRVCRLCLAALLCGFFWEMWNFFSLAKWIYTVPYVNRFHLFEMPILGYSGYLPFGLECAVIAEWFLGKGRG
ncbi:MAG: hypothetical protein ISR85_06615 [Kiritimatiellales bacterium]|nr:hypothetical protein [Kiritimatiellales bacterium]